MEKTLEFIETLKNFNFGSPSSDADEKSFIINTLKHISKRFINHLKKRVDDKNILYKINNLFLDIETIDEAYNLNIELECLIDDLEEWMKKDIYLVHSKDIEKLKEIITKLLKEEKAHYLPLLCNKLGLIKGTEKEAFQSKRIYIEKRIIPLNSKEILELAIEVNKIYNSNDLNSKILEITNQENLKVLNTFDNIKKLIISEVNKAEFIIWIAVAWITDRDLANLLYKKKKEGLNIQLVINNDKINKKLKGLDEHFQVYKVPSKILMHNKFCIIDLKTILHGSYNWTTKAQYNKETLALINSRKEAEKFAKEFIRLKTLL